MTFRVDDTKRKALLYAGAVFLITLIAFSKSRNFEFISMDDPDYVLDNEHMVEGLTVDNVRWAFFNRDYADNWHPLTWISLMSDVDIHRILSPSSLPSKCDERWKSRQNPLRHIMHAHNVMLHALNAALLFCLMMIIAQNRVNPIWPLLLALFWSLHPLRCEVVCWVSERKELLSVFFMLLSLIVYVLPSTRCAKHQAHCTIFSLVFFSLALLAKPVAVTLPAVILAWDWVICKKARIIRLIPFCLFSAATCFMTLRAQTNPIAVGDEQELSVRLMSIFAAPIVYIRQTMWPTGLSMVYRNTTGFDWLLLLLGIGLVVTLIVVGAVWLIRTKRHATARVDWLDIITFGIAWLYVGLIPMLGFVKVASQEHSDRYTYWVGCGLSVVVLMLIAHAKQYLPTIRTKIASQSNGRDEYPQLRKIALVILCISISALAFASSCRMSIWRDTLTLYRDTITKCWAPPIAHVLAAVLIKDYGEEGKKEAEHWLRRCATECKSADSYFELANFLMTKLPASQGIFGTTSEPYEEAESLLQAVLSADPNREEAKKLISDIETLRKKIKASESQARD